MKKSYLLFFLIMLNLTAPSFAAGEEETDKQKILKLDQMVVSATKTPMETKDVPAAVAVVSDEDIKLIPGADTYYDAIRNVPGVNVVKRGGDTSIVLRGNAPSMLHDGRDMNPFVTDAALLTNSLNLGIGSVERIEVIKGPQAAIHGSKAISGVVNVIRKRGDKDNPFAELRGFWGASDEINGGVSLGGGFENLSWFLDFSAGKKDKYKTPNGNIPFVDYEQKNLFARLDYTLSDNHELSFDYTYNRSKNTKGGEGQFYEKSPWNEITSLEPEYQGAFLTYNGKFFDILSLYGSLGVGRNDYEMVYGRPNYEPIHFLNRENVTQYKEDILQGEFRGTVTFFDDRLKSILGLQYKNTRLEGWTDKTVAGVKKPRHLYDADEKYLAPYFQMEFRPIPYLLLVGGVRHDDYDSGDKKMTSTNPNVGFSIFPFASTNRNWTTLWASYSESFNTPKGVQRYIPYPFGGNPDLDPEKAKGWELGLKQRFGTWANLELSYFQTDFEDLIRLAWLGNGEWLFSNVADARVKGYEILFEFYPTDWLVLHFGLTDLDREDKTSGKKLTGQPNQMLQYGLTIPDLYGFSFSLWGYQSKDFKISADKTHPAEDDILWSAKLLYHWDINNKFSLQPFVSVENLTNKTSYDKTTSCGLLEKRTFYAGVSLRINF